MRFLADEDLYFVTVRWLRQTGHDVVAVAESQRRGASDEEVWAWAAAEARILVTRDKGFGPRFIAEPKTGLILVRGELQDMGAIHTVLARAFASVPPAAMSPTMFVVTRTRFRIRRSPVAGS